VDARVWEDLVLGLCCVVVGVFLWLIKRHRSVMMGFTLFVPLAIFLTNLSAFVIPKIFFLEMPPASWEHLIVWTYSGLALLAYAYGVWQAWRPLREGLKRKNPFVVEPKLILVFAGVGAVVNLFAAALPYVPTLSPVLFKLGLLIQLAFIGAVSAAIDRSDYGRLLAAIGIFVPVGLIMVVTTGFAGMLGTFMLHPFLVFLFYKRPRFWKAGIFAVAVYFFFTVASVWFATRGIIREGHLVGLSTADKVTTFFSQFGDTLDFAMVAPESVRMAAANRVDLSVYNVLQVAWTGEKEPYSWGKSLFIDPLLALVPRVLWPGKTITLGDSEFINRYTGLSLSNSNISVDTNITFELYANFGWIGVVAGLFVYGYLMARMELKLMTPGNSLTLMLVLSLLLLGLTSGGRRAAAMMLELGPTVFGAFWLGKFLESSRFLRLRFNREKKRRRRSRSSVPIHGPKRATVTASAAEVATAPA